MLIQLLQQYTEDMLCWENWWARTADTEHVCITEQFFSDTFGKLRNDELGTYVCIFSWGRTACFTESV